MESYETVDPGMFGALGAGLLIGVLVIGLAFYIFTAYCLMKIADKTGTENGWFAFIPILNLILILNIAQKPLWWLVFILAGIIPIIGGLFILGGMVYLYMEVADAVGKPKYWGVIAAFIAPLGLGYLAFAD